MARRRCRVGRCRETEELVETGGALLCQLHYRREVEREERAMAREPEEPREQAARAKVVAAGRSVASVTCSLCGARIDATAGAASYRFVRKRGDFRPAHFKGGCEEASRIGASTPETPTLEPKETDPGSDPEEEGALGCGYEKMDEGE